jgi:ABC-type polysaccharide/polyol phosphate transport system ATPase subunit
MLSSSTATPGVEAYLPWLERPIVEAHNLSKAYRLGEHQSLRGTLAAVRGGPRERQTLLALDDVSFSIRRGECFGVVGSNGSGKSTLLQVLSQITPPTSGYAIMRGRVLPLLAVGTGFHPELTGRENVVLFGTVLGFRRRAILERMDDVVDFAEVGSHIDTPLKRYSSGMQARLSFAVAMMFPAAISIFDEVLAVTDDEFTLRCLESIESVIRDGRTAIFVSHDAGLVRRLCDRVMWLERGAVRLVGPTAEVMDSYHSAHLLGP